MRIFKKADLSLSINAIVVLILAITMLGLGLAFMNQIFGGATEKFAKMGGQVEKQMREQLMQSGKIVDLNRFDVKLKRGEKDKIYIGLKNDQVGDIEFLLYEPGGGGRSSCTKIGDPSVLCGEEGDENVAVLYLTEITVPEGETVVYPIVIKASSSAEEGTYVYDLNVGVGQTQSSTFEIDKILTITIDVTL
ncbi:hypothetical protein J4209_02140 [Candidatus Woesearchaeota archaeon]|nr:hypothetical protein [Candidatus Woesearchaeota archaeon]